MKIFAPFFLSLCILVANPVYGAGDAGLPEKDDTKYIEWIVVEEVLNKVDIGSNDVEQLADFIDPPRRILPEGFYCGVNYVCSDGWNGTEEIPPPPLNPSEVPIPLPITSLLLGLTMLISLKFIKRYI